MDVLLKLCGLARRLPLSIFLVSDAKNPKTTADCQIPVTSVGRDKSGAAIRTCLNNLIIRTYIYLSLAFLVFFMQAGFGFAEAGYIDDIRCPVSLKRIP
jgi:hypothetical protein